MAATFRTRPLLQYLPRPAALQPTPAAIPAALSRHGLLPTAPHGHSLLLGKREYASKRSSKLNRFNGQPAAGSFRTKGRGSNGDRSRQESERPTAASIKMSSRQIPLLMPQTFIAQPLSRCPQAPADFFAYQYARLKQRFVNIFVTLALRMSSKPSFFKAPKWKPMRSSLVPTAKALHSAMSDALARGDKPAVRRVVGDRAADRLIAAIDSRPRGRSYEWELVKYNGYPSIADHKAVSVPLPGPNARNTIVHQAVVRIASRQKLVEIDAFRGVKGSEKVRDVLEYIVIQQVVDPATYHAQDWVIWGTTEETTLESWNGLLDTVKEEEQKNLQKERRKWS